MKIIKTDTLQITLESASFNMIEVKKGVFLMGSDDGDADERPVHTVFVNSYRMAQYPVTQALWYEVMKDTEMARPAFFRGDNRPVERVSWKDAIRFCNALSEKIGLPPAYDNKGNHLDASGRSTQDITKVKGFRLPTEAEWEYAAIGGHLAPQNGDGYHIAEYKFAGSDRLEDVGWYRGNSNRETKDVGQKMPNRLGLYDMSGNVWEWCWDGYDSNYYHRCREKGTATNPIGGEGSFRVVRGGSWFSPSRFCRVADRNDWIPGLRRGVGFRLVWASQSGG